MENQGNSQGNWDARFRPQDLTKYCGNPPEHLINNPPGSILIYGPIGCGKTTLARVIANAHGDPADIIEINAAANRGIETIRELEDRLKYKPMHKKRIVILDEIHGLTSQAVSAFLKISEEPSNDLILIGCTSEPNRLTPALYSRFVTHEVKPPSKEDIKKCLIRISRQVGRNKEWLSAINIIATQANNYRRAIKAFQAMKTPESGINFVEEKQEALVADFVKACISHNHVEMMRIVRTNKVSPNDVYGYCYTARQDAKISLNLMAAARRAESINSGLPNLYVEYAALSAR